MGFISTVKLILQSSRRSQQTTPMLQNSSIPIFGSLSENRNKIMQDLGQSPDVIIREFAPGNSGGLPMALVYIDGLADPKDSLEFLILSMRESVAGSPPVLPGLIVNTLKREALAIGELKDINDFGALYQALLSGDSIVLIDGSTTALSLGTRKWKDRGVEEPNAQTVVRGPRDGFTETLRTNTSLIRRRIKSTNLRMEMMKIGRETQTDVAVMYISGIASEKIVEEVRTRLGRIDIDAVLESGYIEELIQDSTYSPFPTIFNTERPDALAAGMLEGRIAILVDGTPFALMVPALFVQYFQASEDYYQRADFATLLRMLRFLCFFVCMLAPSLYIAVTTFHQELLPPEMLIRLVAAREGVPFPAFVEALLMEITFEILREAGVRMPRSVGQAVSIVGTLVIGQAAVEAGLVSPSMVIIVSITAISNFVIPSFNMGISLRILRFLIMALAASFGLFGIVVALIGVVLHLCSLRSFGVPYMAPFAPFIPEDQKDSIFRLPQWALFSRPRLISQQNRTRENNPPTRHPENRS